MNRSVFLYVGVLVGGFALIAVVAFAYGHFMGITGSGGTGTLDKLPSSLRPHADAIRRAAAPCVHLTAERAKGMLMQSASKFGGEPCLGRGQEWPMTVAGKPMTFIGQLNFGEITKVVLAQNGAAPPDLPQTGVLAFFCDMDNPPTGNTQADQQRWSLVWVPDPDAPAWKGIKGLQTNPPVVCRLVPSVVKSLPSPDDEVFFPAEIRSDDLEKEYAALAESMVGIPRHQVLGHPAIIQEDPRLDAHKAAGGRTFSGPPGYRQGPQADQIRKALAEWRLLWQIDSDKKAGIRWEGNGTVYILIRSADLKAARFDRCWVVEQSD